jgi:hypothetical protein
MIGPETTIISDYTPIALHSVKGSFFGARQVSFTCRMMGRAGVSSGYIR